MADATIAKLRPADRVQREARAGRYAGLTLEQRGLALARLNPPI